MRPPNSEFAVIEGLEERAFNAWPALETVLAEGWVLRFAAGYTKRANSVNALSPRVPAATIFAIAEPLYRAVSLPLIFRLSPLAPDGSDGWLGSQGFKRIDETRVMTAPIAKNLVIDPGFTMTRQSEPSWAAGFAAANRVPVERQAIHDRMLTAIRPPAAFACLHDNGAPIAWGLAVAERGMIGLFDIVTSPDARRKGAARRLVTSLMAWGAAEGASAAYLQVVAVNTAAIALYEQLGFADAYRYHYRMQS